MCIELITLTLLTRIFRSPNSSAKARVSASTAAYKISQILVDLIKILYLRVHILLWKLNKMHDLQVHANRPTKKDSLYYHHSQYMAKEFV